MKKKSLRKRLQELAGVIKPLHEQQGIPPTWSDLGYEDGWPPLTIPWSPSHLSEDPYGYNGPNEAIQASPGQNGWYDCDEAEYYVEDISAYDAGSSISGINAVITYILQNNIPLNTQFSRVIFKSLGGGGDGVPAAVPEYQAGYGVWHCTHPDNPGARYRYIRSRHMYVDGVSIGNATSIAGMYEKIIDNTEITQEQLDQITTYDEIEDLLGTLTLVCLSVTGACGGGCVCQCFQEDNCIAPVYGCMDESAVNYMHTVSLDYVGSNNGTYGSSNQFSVEYVYNPFVNTSFSEYETSQDPAYWNNYNAPGAGICYYNPGCTDSTALNYNSEADFDDGSCIPAIIGCMDENALNYNPSANIEPDGECVYLEDECLNLAGTLFAYSSDINEDNISTLCTNFCQPVSGIGDDGDPYTFDWMSYGSAQYAGETGGPTGEIENPVLYQFCTSGCCDLEYSSAPRYDCSPSGCVEVQEYGAFDSLQACIDSGCSGEFIWTGCNSFADWLTSVSIESLGGISEEVFCNNCFENIPMGDAWQLWGEFFNEQCNCCDGFTVYDQCQNIDNLYINVYCNYTFENIPMGNESTNDWLENNFIPSILSAYPYIGECCDTPYDEKKTVAPSAIANVARSLGIPLPKGDTIQKNPQIDRMQKLAGITKLKK